MHIKCFTTNPFSENTYLVWNDPQRAIVIDPGFYTPEEEMEFIDYLKINNIKLGSLLLTHAHIDHIFGCEFIYNSFGLKPRMHRKEEIVYQSASMVCKSYGLNMFNFPEADQWIDEGSLIVNDSITFDVLFTPGHSPGSISYYSRENNLLFSGDVLFEGSIGRTDLPGGNFETLINSIKSELLILAPQTKVYSGHGGVTNIGQEKLSNPFL